MAAVLDDRTRALAEGGFLSIREACQFLGMSRAWLYSAMDRGDLAFAKIGGARRIPKVALVELGEKSIVAR